MSEEIKTFIKRLKSDFFLLLNYHNLLRKIKENFLFNFDMDIAIS